MDCGRGKRGEGRGFTVCVFNDMVRQREHPPSAPRSLKALGNVNNIKRATLTFLGILWGGVMNLKRELCIFRIRAAKSSITGLLQNNINPMSVPRVHY